MTQRREHVVGPAKGNAMSLVSSQMYRKPVVSPDRVRTDICESVIEPLRTRAKASFKADIEGALGVPTTADADIGTREPGREELVERLVAAFRWHPHINNVLTHICGSQWMRVSQALRMIVDPASTRRELSPLALNIVELMWAESGVTGRILKPYLCDVLARNLPRPAAYRLQLQIAGLCVAQEENSPSREYPTGGCDTVRTAEGVA
jgi:hypothetical protein